MCVRLIKQAITVVDMSMVGLSHTRSLISATRHHVRDSVIINT